MLWLAVALVVGYLVGGFPTSIIAGKVLRGIDVRDYGSGNAGATNVWRVLGAGPAIGVLAIDAAKGVAAVLLVSRLVPPGAAPSPDLVRMLCGVMAIVGHVWTPFAGFRGGKGVGTAAGVLGALAPWAVLAAVVAFVVVVALTRYISLGSIAAAAVLPFELVVQRIVAPATVPWTLVVAGIVICLLVILRHRSNIRRLMKGTENRFGKPATAGPTP